MSAQEQPASKSRGRKFTMMTWSYVLRLIGKSPHAVAFRIDLMPDGSWLVGICLRNRAEAVKQRLFKSLADLEEDPAAEWNVEHGFKKGVNARAAEVTDAINQIFQRIQSASVAQATRT